MIDMERFGQKLKSHRRRLGLSQEQVARMVHVTNQAVSKWENGATLPDIEALLQLAELTGSSVESLLIDRPTEKATDSARLSDLLASLGGVELVTKPLAVLANYFSQEEVFEAVRLFQEGDAGLRLKMEASDRRSRATSLVEKEIPLENLSWGTLQELDPALYDVCMTVLKKTNHDIERVVEILRCPTCSAALSLAEDRTKLTCAGRHSYKILEHVIYFGTREDPGNPWSFGYTVYEQFVAAKNGGDNRLSRSEGAQQGFSEMLALMRARRPERILEVGTGEGTWGEYLLRNVDWPCCLFLTDLSHRILKYDRRYLSERYYNPYVSLFYLACDARALPLKDDSMDCVTSWGGYENMGADYDAGLRESQRVLKEGGEAIYCATACDDTSSDLVQRWIRLLTKIGVYEMASSMICDRAKWEAKNRGIGFRNFEYRKIADEKPAPDTDEFPYENEIMQWMGQAVIRVTK